LIAARSQRAEQARVFYDENPQLFETGDRYRARHVLVRVAPDAPAQDAINAMARLNEARRRVIAGEDFGAVALEFSDDAGSKGRGGEIAVFSRGEVPAKLAEEVAELEPGDISPSFRSTAGYHFAELLERLPGERREFDAVREGLKQRLLVQQRQRHIQDFVNDLRRKARIETFI
jgi:parvulin-like peptidyl-prolyl isomerase